jgi:hypothetical protein
MSHQKQPITNHNPMKNIKHSFLITLAGIALSACTKDFVNKELKGKSLNILSPLNGYVSSSGTITFWWDVLDGADSYNIQVVKPSFAAIQSIVVDTTTTKNKLTYSLLPGNYEWRIKGINSSGSSQYSIYSFTIDSTLNLGNQVVTLISPASNTLSNKLSQKLHWQSVYLANHYQLEIWSGTGLVDTKTNLLNDSLTYLFTSEGQYKWRVLAQNSLTNSQFSAFSNLTIDQTRPLISTPTFPISGDTASTGSLLKWTRNSADASGDSIYISSDSTFNPLYQLKADYITATTYPVPSGTIAAKKYYWHLRTVDGAGNWSSNYSSNLYKFKAK